MYAKCQYMFSLFPLEISYRHFIETCFYPSISLHAFKSSSTQQQTACAYITSRASTCKWNITLEQIHSVVLAYLLLLLFAHQSKKYEYVCLSYILHRKYTVENVFDLFILLLSRLCDYGWVNIILRCPIWSSSYYGDILLQLSDLHANSENSYAQTNSMALLCSDMWMWDGPTYAIQVYSTEVVASYPHMTKRAESFSFRIKIAPAIHPNEWLDFYAK